MVVSSNRGGAKRGEKAANAISEGTVRSLPTIAGKDRLVQLIAHLDRVAEMLSHSSLARGQRLSLSVNPLNSALPHDEAIAVGLILNEIVANAAKHALGVIAISFELTGPGWRLAVSADRRENTDHDVRPIEMNTPAIQALVRKLDARVVCSCHILHGFTVSVIRGRFEEDEQITSSC